jgi:hypothetical protein
MDKLERFIDWNHRYQCEHSNVMVVLFGDMISQERNETLARDLLRFIDRPFTPISFARTSEWGLVAFVCLFVFDMECNM